MSDHISLPDQNKLIIFCNIVLEHEQYPSTENQHGKSYRSDQVFEDPDPSTESATVNTNCRSKIRSFFLRHIEQSSDELNKKFSYKCKVCCKVTSSFGNESKACTEMERHISVHHLSQNGVVESRKRKRASPPKSVKSRKRLHRDTEWAAALDHTYSIPLDHTYQAKHIDDTKREHSKPELDRLFLCDLMKIQCTQIQPTISAPPYPKVYDPLPLEPAHIVEFTSTCDPTRKTEPAVQPSTSGISKKAVENKSLSSKFTPASTTPRCILECVENRVTRKLSASSEQRNAIVPDTNVENGENIKNLHEIVSREIQLLKQQKRSRLKKSSNICAICNCKFTASSSLIHHYNSHLKLKPFKCCLCLKCFTRKHSLNYHYLWHKNLFPYMCRFCDAKFRHPFHFKVHENKHTGDTSYSCEYCPNTFQTRHSFKRHLKNNHRMI